MGESANDTVSDAAPLQVQMVVHDHMTALDLVGPQLIFATLGNVEVHLVGPSRAAVVTDTGIRIIPDLPWAEAPAAPDVIFVPGGIQGTTALLQDGSVVPYLASRGSAARCVTGVCTGVLLLGAAGLLRGRRATAHWYVRDLLPLFDAVPEDRRVVVDGNRVTGAGVTAGIDMALTVSARLRGPAHARIQELMFEYAPRPPFNAGTPRRAGAALTAQVRQFRKPYIEAARQAAEQARARWACP